MTELIAWANNNTGFLMAVLTAVYVIATIWIVYESRRNNRLMSLFEKDRIRPHVVFWIEAEMQTHGQYFSTIQFVGKVRNEGASTAHDVQIMTTPKLSARRSANKEDKNAYYTLSFLENSTSILVPKQMLIETIGPTEFLLKDNDENDLKFKVLIEYKDISGEKYSSAYFIDLSRNKNQLFAEDIQTKAFYKLVEKVESSAHSLKDINRTLNQPDRSNLFQKEAGLKLSDRQVKLLSDIVQADKESETVGEIWFLSEVVGRTSICKASPKRELELDVNTHDILALSQAGHIRGYYRDNIFWFYVTPSAESFVKKSLNKVINVGA